MTIDQFNSLRIGHEVMRTDGSGTLRVTEIDRAGRRIQTSGPWRYYKHVDLPPASLNMTPRIELPQEVTYPVSMLKKYGLIQTAIILAVQKAGPGGFIGDMDTLCHNTVVCTVRQTCRNVMSQMVRAGVLKYVRVNRNIFRLFIDE